MITTEQLDFYKENGYLKVAGVFDPAADFDPVFEEYTGVLDRLCDDLERQGRLSERFEDLPFPMRYKAVCNATGQLYSQLFTMAYPQMHTKADTPVWQGDAVFGLLAHPRVLDAMEHFVGPEVALSPVGNVRIKIPEREVRKSFDGEGRAGIIGTTPWHQDNGVITEAGDETEMTTVWYPMTDATVEMGCLQVYPGTHRGGVVTHCPNTGEIAIPDQLLPASEPLPVPLERGDILILHRRLLHASLPNVSDETRWSLDLRYIPAGKPSGRPAFPTITVRSKADPAAEVHDPQVWRDKWQAARDKLVDAADSTQWNRWNSDAAACA